MSSSTVLATSTQQLTATPTSSGSSGSTASGDASSAIDSNTIAGNFTTFLTLLTTQLQNQDPLDPLDTNQFTQQLVEFAQVEQQLKSNDQLATLISLQQTAQGTQVLGFVGKTVAVDGTTAQLTNGQAQWSLSITKPCTLNVSITNASGQTVYSNSFTAQAGTQSFDWDGRGNDGTQWPDGSYTISATATDASGQSTGVSTEIEGTVDSVDLTQTPPVLSIGGQNFTVNQIKRIVQPTTVVNTALTNPSSLLSGLTGASQ